MNAAELVQRLDLAPHPREGGFFKRIYTAAQTLATTGGERNLATSIHYALTGDSPTGYLHKNSADVLHFFHSGAPLRYHLVSPKGDYEQLVLGADLALAQRPFLHVPGGWWKASELLVDCNDYAYISEVVTPGFAYADNHLARAEDLVHLSAELQALLQPLLAPAPV